MKIIKVNYDERGEKRLIGTKLSPEIITWERVIELGKRVKQYYL